jgi:hypothetical protein
VFKKERGVKHGVEKFCVCVCVYVHVPTANCSAWKQGKACFLNVSLVAQCKAS